MLKIAAAILLAVGRSVSRQAILEAVVLVGLLIVSPAARAEYFTYQTWSALNEIPRAVYIAGAYDSLMIFADTEAEGKFLRHFRKCIGTAQMSNFQLATNVLNFAKDRPALQTGSVQEALIVYLSAACGGKPPTE
jgi:hypothetical protein